MASQPCSVVVPCSLVFCLVIVMSCGQGASVASRPCTIVVCNVCACRLSPRHCTRSFSIVLYRTGTCACMGLHDVRLYACVRVCVHPHIAPGWARSRVMFAVTLRPAIYACCHTHVHPPIHPSIRTRLLTCIPAYIHANPAARVACLPAYLLTYTPARIDRVVRACARGLH